MQEYEVLLVAVQEHIFTIIHLGDKELATTQRLYLDGQKYYYLA